MQKFQEQFSTRKRKSPNKTDQQRPIPGRTDQVKNESGGYVFRPADKTRLERFLILGTEGGTFYAKEEKLTKESTAAVMRCLIDDPIGTIDLTVEISEKGRAYKNDPALFVMALAMTHPAVKVRQYVQENFNRVARIGTHIFHFADYLEGLRGWGQIPMKTIASWFLSKEVDQLEYQLLKYQQRDGWSMRDLLRLSHPSPNSFAQSQLFRWAVSGQVPDSPGIGKLIRAFEALKKFAPLSAGKGDEEIAAAFISDFKLTREMIPSELLKSDKVWKALLENMPLGALIRNLGNLSKHGLTGRGQWEGNQNVGARLTDGEALRKARIHPVGILAALTTYASGHGARSSGSWDVSSEITKALNTAFYKTFDYVEPTGQRTIIGLDVSGSMTFREHQICGVPGLTPNIGAAAMCMVTKRIEPFCEVMAFAHDFKQLNISADDTLQQVMRETDHVSFGRTDCALPMIWARQNRIKADAFIIYTDNETWAGRIHPCQALKEYRNWSGIPAKLAVVGMCSNGFTIADPKDAGMMDFVGFSTGTPKAISMFLRGA